MGWNYWSIPKVCEWISNFIPHFTGLICSWLSMLGLKSIHGSIRGPWRWLIDALDVWPGTSPVATEKRHNDVIEWKHFPPYWPFVRGIHRSPVNSHHKRPVTRSLCVSFDLRLNKRLSKQSKRRWFEKPLRSFWRHCNAKVLFSVCWYVRFTVIVARLTRKHSKICIFH